MAEELNNQEPQAEAPKPVEPAAETVATEAAASVAVEASESTEAKPAETATAEQDSEPQVIIQKERGFSHYVGFALLCVICICFFFIPGIALTFGVSRLVDLSGAAAWIFSAILSFVAWLIFKLKIKGFKKSFYFYIGLCVLVLAILIGIEVATEKFNVFSSIFALLSGAAS